MMWCVIRTPVWSWWSHPFLSSPRCIAARFEFASVLFGFTDQHRPPQSQSVAHVQAVQGILPRGAHNYGLPAYLSDETRNARVKLNCTLDVVAWSLKSLCLALAFLPSRPSSRPVCKSCLERHIVTTRKNDVVCCPIKGCHSQLIATHPMKTEIRFDRVMQNLVDKLLPKFAAEEDELKTAIAREHGRGEPSVKRTATAAGTSTDAAAEPAAKRQKFGDEKLSVAHAQRGRKCTCLGVYL